MKERKFLRQAIFEVSNPQQFNELALEIFHYQASCCHVYNQFCSGVGFNDATVSKSEHLPFLPVTLFKSHKVLCNDLNEELVFESSGTTGSLTSRHYVADTRLYEESMVRSFERFFGSLTGYSIFALLPGYLERGNSSLVYMVEKMRWKSNRSFGGFYLHELDKLAIELQEAAISNTRVMLIGVTHALLDMAERHPMSLPELIVVETGGMKGRRSEITRMELHDRLKQGFGVEKIYSEYGMTELLSQAWSNGNGLYRCPPWMKIVIRDTNDPLSLVENGRVGGINVIDLANLDSCSFIATQDLGRLHDDGTFEVLGRFDDSDVRGCSLMVST